MNPKINWHPTRPELRKFGAAILVGFALIGGLLLWRGHMQAAHGAWIVSAVVGIVAIAMPPLALPFYLVWMGFAFVMGSVMSRLILVLIFYGVLTPLAIVMRIAGRDALRRKKSSSESGTYWISHPEVDPKDYEHLF